MAFFDSKKLQYSDSQPLTPLPGTTFLPPPAVLPPSLQRTSLITTSYPLWYTTSLIPAPAAEGVSIECEGWVQRVTDKGALTVYPTVYAYDENKKQLGGKIAAVNTGGTYFHYPEGAKTLSSGHWYQFKTIIGPGGEKPLLPEAHYYSFGIGLNYRGTLDHPENNDTYLLTDWSIRQIEG